MAADWTKTRSAQNSVEVQESTAAHRSSTDISGMDIDSLQNAPTIWSALGDTSSTVEYVLGGWAAPALLALAAVWALSRWRRSWLVVRCTQWLLVSALLVVVVHHVQDVVDRSAVDFDAANRSNAATVQAEFGRAVEPGGLGCLQDLADGAVQECMVAATERGRTVKYLFTIAGDTVTVSRDGSVLKPR